MKLFRTQQHSPHSYLTYAWSHWIRSSVRIGSSVLGCGDSASMSEWAPTQPSRTEWFWILGYPEFWIVDLLSIVLDGVVLPHTEPMYNLGVLLDSRNWWWPRPDGLFYNFMLCINCLLSWIKRTCAWSLMLLSSPNWIRMQRILNGTPLSSKESYNWQHEHLWAYFSMPVLHYLYMPFKLHWFPTALRCNSECWLVPIKLVMAYSQNISMTTFL